MATLSNGDRKWRNAFLRMPMIATLLAAGLLFVCTFLPILTAKEDLRTKLIENPNGTEMAGDLMTNEQTIDISMPEFYKIQCNVHEIDEPLELSVGIGLFFGSAILSVLIFLLVLFKHPIPAMLFNLAGCCIYQWSIKYILEESERAFRLYDWGIARNLFSIAFILVFAGNIWLLIKKIMFKHELKRESSTEYLLEQLNNYR